MVFEVNFDGLVGPTHNYAGLSPGNLAATSNAGSVSSPRRAALQGLQKMKLLSDMGLIQGVLPPHPRPDMRLLASLGFSGDSALADAAREAPALLASACSASAMWTANAATVSPSSDTADGRVHLTPANLVSNLHRTIETPHTTEVLRRIFADATRFVVHDPLPGSDLLGDEGAANHVRLASSHGAAGVELFVYGSDGEVGPARFRARQSRDACRAVARLHGLSRVVFAQQHPEAIDAGVFHNDVISTGNERVLLFHELAFATPAVVIDELRRLLPELQPIEATTFSLEEAVASYVFNSQLLTRPDGSMLLLAPRECDETPAVRNWLDRLVDTDSPIEEVRTIDLRESMRNGGGPACLRLRVVLTDDQIDALGARVILNQGLYDELTDWVERHYREELAPSDLADPQLAAESQQALADLSTILALS